MTANISINNSGTSSSTKEYAYLIHGQYFRLDYKISNCWFCIFLYDNGESFFKKLYFKKCIGIFENITNAYKPNFKIFAFGSGIKVFRYNLKINFINSKPSEIEVNRIKKPKAVHMDIHFKLPQFSLPSFNKSKTINFQLDKNTIKIIDHKELDKLIFESKNK
jgi:hypothetical protein